MCSSLYHLLGLHMQLSSTEACGKVIVGPEPPTAAAATAASREGGEGSPSSSCEDVCTLRIKSEDGNTVRLQYYTHTHTHVLPCCIR